MKRNNKAVIRMSLRKRKGFMAPCAFLLGFLSVVAQVYLMRELMIVFSGNELVFGLVLGVWLFGTALGSMLLKMRSRAWVVWLFLGSLLLLPVVLLGSRFLNHFLGIPSGNLTDLGRVVLGSFLLILPVAVLLGGIYGVLVRLYKDAVRIYIFETAGFALGGLVTVVVFLFPCPPGLDQFSRMASWPGYSFVEQRQSHYGHLMVIERASQKSLVENGRHLLTGDNVLSAEEVHPPLLWHPDPQDVLMVGGGFSQAGKEALKHPLSRLVYAELDPELLRLEEKHFSFVDDQRLQLITGDPRRYLRGSKDLYDVIVIHAGDPLSLLSARFFSRDFFMEARQRLKPGGILAVSQSLSENYVALKGRAYASSVYTTLFSVFSNVQFIPGDQLIWMATDSGYLLSFDILNQRLKARGVATQYMDASYFKDRMSPNRARLMRRWLSLSEEISTDEKPLAMVKALSFLTERTDTAFSAVVDFLIRRGGWLWGALPLVAGMVFLRREKWDGLMWGMGITGLTQMAFQVTVILGVQAFFGHAYALVGVLSAGFMSGALIGALWGPRFLRTNVMAWAISFQVLMALGLLMCWQYCPEGLFILSILGGMAGGNLFAIYVSRVTHERAGYVYAADLLGACAGALVVGVFLIPLWGVVTTMLWVALLNLVLLGGCTRLRGFNGT